MKVVLTGSFGQTVGKSSNGKDWQVLVQGERK